MKDLVQNYTAETKFVLRLPAGIRIKTALKPDIRFGQPEATWCDIVVRARAADSESAASNMQAAVDALGQLFSTYASDG